MKNLLWLALLLFFSASYLAPAVLAGPAPVQRGFDTKTYKQHGLTFPEPRSYTFIPIDPLEDWVIFRYAKKLSEEEQQSPRLQPQFRIVRIDYVSDPAPVTQVEEPAEGEEEEPESSGGDEPETEEARRPADEEDEEEEEKEPPPINSFERYLEQKWPGWGVRAPQEGKERKGYVLTEYEFIKPEKNKAVFRAYAYVWRKDGERVFAVLGFASERDFKDEQKVWREVATKMRFEEPVPSESSKIRKKWERTYARTKFINPEYRIRVRERLGGKWKAEDTEHYIVLYSTKDQPLVRKVLKQVELLNSEYRKYFPPIGEITAVSTIRVCKDQNEYYSYGGPQGSAGYWNWMAQELVLYDATKREKGKKTDKTDTFIVLNHEAFHQYIYYAASQTSPDYWFNEGNADYFSGAVIKGGKLKRVGVNTWRLGYIQHLISESNFFPWRRILEFERKQFYDPRLIGPCYAQAWSMVYFLKKSKDVEKNEKWAAILPTYYDTLKAEWKEEFDILVEDGTLDDPETKENAARRARKKAHAAAFDGVDVDELERLWKEFVLALKPPK